MKFTKIGATLAALVLQAPALFTASVRAMIIK
jgi:hypothetical protein